RAGRSFNLNRRGRSPSAGLGLRVVNRLRRQGLVVEMEREAKSLKSQMRRADKLKARSVLIVGDDELQKGRAVLRYMASKQQAEIAFDNIEAELLSRKAN